MSQTQASLKIFAPAKVNLYLHVTHKRADGYHELDSLVDFADIGDEIIITPKDSPHFEFEISGPFAGGFSKREIESGPHSNNLVIKAARALAQKCGHPLDMHIELVKNLPFGAGLGGGSADAAAVIWGLLKYWRMPYDSLSFLNDFMLELGADVPMCFHSQAMRVRGVGEIFDEIKSGLPACPILLVHPHKTCSTPRVFSHFQADFKSVINLPSRLDDLESLIDFLSQQSNALTQAAVKNVPEIENILHILSTQDGALLSRMSGSGSCCFAIFEKEEQAKDAATMIKASNPDWWVASGTLGHIERY